MVLALPLGFDDVEGCSGPMLRLPATADREPHQGILAADTPTACSESDIIRPSAAGNLGKGRPSFRIYYQLLIMTCSFALYTG